MVKGLVKQTIRSVMGYVIAAIFLYAALLIAISCMMWLKNGVWYHDTVASLLAQNGILLPKLSWLGAQSIIDGVMSWPASFVIGFVGVFLFYIVFGRDF
jgi:hypothetical protein